MRILIRTSKWAIWARRLGSFALPLAVIPVLMHRAGAISTQTFETVEVLAIGVALLALGSSIVAFARIWVTGDQGWGRAITGLVFSLACLAPLGYFSVEYLRFPTVEGVSTDVANPPPLTSDLHLGAPAPAQVVAAVFPNVKTRHYPVSSEQMFGIVDKLVMEHGWEVQLRRTPDVSSDGQINAIAMSLFGFRDEVSIRIASDADGSSVDMRTASLSPLHEAGINGSRIEEFLGALDARITLLIKNEPAGASDEDADTTDQTDQAPVIPAPAPRGRKR